MSKTNVIWLRPKEESVDVKYANKPFVAACGFITDKGRRWATDYKEFNNAKHLDNFIAYIERTKGYMFDEVWVRE